MLVPRFYEDLNVMHDKTMPARTYYIPASVRMNDLVEHRERSDRFQLLNGEWKFQYYNSIYDVTESFYEKGYDVSGFDQVTEIRKSRHSQSGYCCFFETSSNEYILT